MDDKKVHKTGVIATRCGIHANTVRTWADMFSDIMSESATSTKRRFTDDDMLIIATISEFRQQGVSFDGIRIALDNGQRVESVSTKSAKLQPENVLVPTQVETEKALQRIEYLESELIEIKAERDRVIDRWQDDTTALNDKIQGLERAIGEAQGKLEIMQIERKTADYWLRIIILVIFITVLFAVALGILLSTN